jgi:hypothetical protein
LPFGGAGALGSTTGIPNLAARCFLFSASASTVGSVVIASGAASATTSVSDAGVACADSESADGGG